jgi:hypothetical protein
VALNDAQRRDLKDLREAARQRDPQQAQYLAKRLIGQIAYYHALALVVGQLYEFIDIFESYYPDETWIRRALVSIASFGTPPDDGIAQMALEQAYHEPGAANFVKAFYDVTQAMQTRHTPEARVGYLTSALVNVVMAALVEAWYGERPEAWQYQRQNPGDPDALELAYLFWTDDETAQLDTALWLDIADGIEQALARQAAPPDL